MTIQSAAVGDPIPASVLNQVFAHVNNGAGRAVFTANGTWVVPAGVHQFRVYLCGGGGPGGAEIFSDGSSTQGLPGGSSPLISAIISGQAIGASFNIVIGAGAVGGSTDTGGTSTFGALLQVTGGKYWSTTPGAKNGAATFPPGAPEVYHSNGLFGFWPAPGSMYMDYMGYGTGGVGGYLGLPPQSGAVGICVIEW